MTWVLDLEVRRMEVGGPGNAVRLPGAAEWGRLAEVGVMGAVVALVLVASAKSSFAWMPHRVGVLVVVTGVLGLLGVMGWSRSRRWPHCFCTSASGSFPCGRCACGGVGIGVRWPCWG